MAHELNISKANRTHRHNLLLDSDDNVYLADFGIAKDTFDSNTLTETDEVVGSPAYFPPEQIQGQEVGPSADIYSLGIALYDAGDYAGAKAAFAAVDGNRQGLAALWLVQVAAKGGK